MNISVDHLHSGRWFGNGWGGVCLDGILKKSGVYLLGGGLDHIFEMCIGIHNTHIPFCGPDAT